MNIYKRLTRRLFGTAYTKIFQKDPSIEFRVIESKDKLKIMDLEAGVFSRNVPLSKMCNTDKDVHFELVKDDANKEDKHKLSTMAIHTQLDKFISAVRAEPYSDYFNAEALLTPKEDAPLIYKLLCSLDAQWNDLFRAKGLQPNSSEFAYYKTGFTHDDYHGKGIFNGLWGFTEEYLKSKGYRYVFALLVSKPMQKVMLEKFGWEPLKIIPYADLLVYGEPLFREVVALNPQYKDDNVIFGFKELK